MSEKKSRYQQKMRRKHGSARPDPRWMWWFERGRSVQPEAKQAPSLEIQIESA